MDTVFDGLEEQLHLKVDREKVVYLRMPYKGVPVPAVIRTKMDADSKEKAGFCVNLVDIGLVCLCVCVFRHQMKMAG